MQKGENNGQAAGDDHKMKKDECAETETTRRTGGAGGDSSDGETEPGQASMPASRKPPQDKHRSMAELDTIL
jgi:hypothetical protein